MTTSPVLDGITPTELEHRYYSYPDPVKSREFRCDECGARCTRLKTTDAEAGHYEACSNAMGRLGFGQRERGVSASD
jgi:hypothetical protein